MFGELDDSQKEALRNGRRLVTRDALMRALWAARYPCDDLPPPGHRFDSLETDDAIDELIRAIGVAVAEERAGR